MSRKICEKCALLYCWDFHSFKNLCQHSPMNESGFTNNLKTAPNIDTSPEKNVFLNGFYLLPRYQVALIRTFPNVLQGLYL